MKIILFTPKLFAGGAEQVAFLLASGLTAIGHEVVIATPSATGDFAEKITKRFFITDFKKEKPIQSTRALSELIHAFHPDACICFGMVTGIAASLSKLIFRWKTPLFIRNENNLIHDWKQARSFNRFLGPLLSRWAARNSHVICVSESMREATAEYLNIKKNNITTILNPVINDTLNEVNSTLDDLHPWLREKSIPAFVAIGRLEHQKGFDTLIDAFSKVKNKHDTRLIIFGNGSLRDSLQEKIKSAGLVNAIALAGYTNSPLLQMQAAKAFVLSSRFEGFGLVLVEALWTGTRIISSDCNYGPREILEDGKYGTLVPTEDSEALADAMIAELCNPQPLQRPGESWFQKYTATEAARSHVALIEARRNRCSD